MSSLETENQELVEEEIVPDIDNLSQEIFGCSFMDSPSIDKNLTTCELGIEWGQPVTTFLQVMEEQTNTIKESEEEEDYQEYDDVSNTPKSINELIQLVQSGKSFCATEGLGKTLGMLHELEDHLTQIWSEKRVHPTQRKDDSKDIPHTSQL